MADTGARVDVVVAEAGANELLHQERLLVGAARRRNAADRVLAILGLDALELGSGMRDRRLPRYFTPRLADLGADHRLEDALAVIGVTPGEAALDARMAAVRLA